MTPSLETMQSVLNKPRTLLPLDMCRCHDSSCDVRECCVRWIDRHVSGPVPHVETFRLSGDSCSYQIKY